MKFRRKILIVMLILCLTLSTFTSAFALDGKRAVQVSANGYHSLALTDQGEVFGWGKNDYNQITIPSDLPKIKQIDTGLTHSVLLQEDGQVVVLGESAYGSIQPPAGLSNVIKISSSVDHILALLSDGTVIAWGRNDSGEANVPSDLTGVVDIAAGHLFSVALLSDGTVRTWGRQASIGEIPSEYNSENKSVLAGDGHVVLHKNDDTIQIYGTSSHSATAIPSELNKAKSVYTYRNTTIAIDMNDVVHAWGNDSYSQVTGALNEPDLAYASIGNSHTLGIKKDGTVVGWGRAEENQLEIPLVLTIPAPDEVVVNIVLTGSLDASNHVALSWSTVENATSYNVYRGASSDALQLLASGVTTPAYVDNTTSDDTTYYYAVDAVVGGVKSNLSNIFSIKTNGLTRKVVLHILLDNGSEKDYLLTESEFNQFESWAMNINRSPVYKIEKQSLLFPYQEAYEYLIFNKMLYFESRYYNQ